jgi:Undecaprenyl pyrophosphate synthase
MNLKNIAIIMDGNGRWAKKNNLQIREGHARGVSALKEIVKESKDQNIDLLRFMHLARKIEKTKSQRRK